MPMQRPQKGLSLDYSTALLPPKNQCSKPDRSKGSSVKCPTMRLPPNRQLSNLGHKKGYSTDRPIIRLPSNKHCPNSAALRTIAQGPHPSPIFISIPIPIPVSIRLLHTEGFSVDCPSPTTFLPSNKQFPNPGQQKNILRQFFRQSSSADM
jgi:hypothetical protein